MISRIPATTFYILSTLLIGCATPSTKVRNGPIKGDLAPVVQIDSSRAEPDTIPTPGRWMVVEFLSEHCASCRRVSADLDRLARKAEYSNVKFLGVVSGAEPSRIASLRKKERIQFDWISDPRGAIRHQYAVVNVPTVFVIDATGRIVFVGDGEPGDARRIAATLSRQLHITDESTRAE